MASLHKNRRTTLERIEKFVSRVYFTDVNLYGRIYPQQDNVGTRKDLHYFGYYSYDSPLKNCRYISLALTSE